MISMSLNSFFIKKPLKNNGKLYFLRLWQIDMSSIGYFSRLFVGENILSVERTKNGDKGTGKVNKSRNNDVSDNLNAGNFIVNGNVWEPTTVTIKINGRSNYILTKLRLLKPNLPKTQLARELLEEALLKIDEKITEL